MRDVRRRLTSARSSRVLLGSVGALMAFAAAGAPVTMPASAAIGQPSLTFGAKIVLGNNVGGEPSLQDDGHGHVYVTSPTGIASAVVNATGVLTVNEATGGGALWRSLDGGATFANPTAPIFFGTKNGGGDTDVTTDVKTKLYTADLEAAAADIQSSTDHGATFSQPPSQAGPSNDREWLTPVGDKLFLTYHEFNTNADLIFVSTDGGTVFVPAGLGGKIIDPTDNPAAAADCALGNLISKPVTDSKGGIYIVLNCSTFPSNVAPTGAPLNRLYVAISRDNGNTFKTKLASDVGAGGGTWGHVFNQLGIDNGGNLYIAASGHLRSADVVQTYLIRSVDNGGTWKAPLNLNADTPANAAVFPALATGQSGQVAVGYYRVVSCIANASCKGTSDYRPNGVIFQFFISESLNANQAVPTFTTTQLTTTSPHQDGICTDGLFCGTPLSSGGNRNLADFESMAVDPAGHLEVVIPADPTNLATTLTGTSTLNPTVNWFYKQTGGPLLVPGPTNGNGTGNQTYVSGAFTSPPTPAPVVAAAASPTPSILPDTAGATPVTPVVTGFAMVLLALLAGLPLVGLRQARRRR